MSGTGSWQNATDETTKPLVWAFVIALAIHLVLFGGFQAGQKFGWWRKDLLPAWLKKPSQTLAALQKPLANPPPAAQEVPLMFVEVDPTVATPEPPKNAKYYSSRNSQAANPDAQVETDTPKIDGSQTHVVKTETALRSKAIPLQPSLPKEATPPQEEAQAKPKGGQNMGDLALAKPEPNPLDKLLDKPGDGQADGQTGEATTETHKRPRTLAEAYLQQPNLIPGEKMKEDGGVRRHLVASSLDTKATPFGEYDRELIYAIQTAWYQLLDNQKVATAVSGTVTVDFLLKYDGHITEMRVVQSSVDGVPMILCERAIEDPAPYAPWPSDMRRLIGAEYREVRFTFYYE